VMFEDGERVGEGAYDDFDEMLADMQELSRHLDSFNCEDVRPETATTSASTSASTAAPASSVRPSTAGDAEESAPEDPSGGLTGVHRAHFDVQHLKLPHGCRLEDSPSSPSQFFFSVDCTSGPYMPATLTFWIKVFDEFPEPGSISVRSTKRIFHPSVDVVSSRVEVPEDCLDVPAATLHAAPATAAPQFVAGLSALLTFLRQLVLAPADNLLAANQDAATMLQTDPDEFRRTVRLTLNGGEHRGLKYDRVLNIGKSGSTLSSSHPPPEKSKMSDEVKLQMMQLSVLRDKCVKVVGMWEKMNEMEIADINMSM